MMNLYHAWDFPLGHLVIANLTPFTKVYRPAGAVFYRVMYAVFGFHPLPFRITIYCLLLLNIALIYWLAKLMSNSTEIGVLAALIGAYHNRVMDIYVFGGTVYDVLCFSFYLLAACIYIRARSQGTAIHWRTWAVFVVLNVLALNSKEMAATLPLVLLAYELLYHGNQRRLPLRVWPLWLAFAMTIVVTIIRTGGGTPFSGNADYAIHLSIRQFFLTSRQLADDLFLLPAGSFSTTKVVLLFVLVWAIALIAQRRDLLLSAFIITVAPLPINFIPYRGFFVMYLPLVGWAMFVAILAVAGRDWPLARVWHRPALPPGTWEPERMALFLFTLYALFNLHSHDAQRSFLYPDKMQTNIRTLNDSLVRMHLPIPRGGSVLFVSNALEDPWMPLYVVRLFYHDPSIAVDLEAQRPDYDRRLALCDQGYCEVGK